MRKVPPLVLVLLIWAVSLGAAAQFGKFAVLFDRVAAAYPGQALPLIGLIVSSVGFVGLIFGTTAGLIVSGLGYRRVMVGALLAGAAVSGIEALLPSLPVMFGLRVIEGLSHLCLVVSAPVLISQLANGRWQPAAMSLYSTFFAVSFALTGYFGPHLADYAGIPAVFLTHACYLMVAAVLMALVLPHDGPARLPRLSLPQLWRDHLAIYASPRVATPAMGFVCYTVTFVAFLTLMPQAFAGRPEQIVLATFMPLVTVAVSLTLGVWSLGHLPAVRVVQIGFAAAVGFSGLLWVVWQAPGLTVLAAFGVAAGLGLVQSASFAAIPQLNATADARARASGAIAQLGNVGTTSGTPLLVWLMSVAGVTGLALFLAGFSALGIFLHGLQARRRLRRAD
jgi:MFS transporter, DHA1 family, inner membrane transport protein